MELWSPTYNLEPQSRKILEFCSNDSKTRTSLTARQGRFSTELVDYGENGRYKSVLCSLFCTLSTGALGVLPNLHLDSISEVYEQNEKSFEDVVWVGDVNYWNLL